LAHFLIAQWIACAEPEGKQDRLEPAATRIGTGKLGRRPQKRKAALAGAIALALVAPGLCYAAATTIHSIGNGSGASMQCATHTRTGWIFDHNKTAITTFKLRRR